MKAYNRLSRAEFEAGPSEQDGGEDCGHYATQEYKYQTPYSKQNYTERN
jgi:hypothetical protein